MKLFKFLNSPIAIAHDGGQIYAGDVFYTMNKQEIPSIKPNQIIPKYTIVRRFVSKQYEDVFKPDYETLWYFRSRQNAEYLKTIWITQDLPPYPHTFLEQADLILRFTR